MQASPLRIDCIYILQSTADIRSWLDMTTIARSSFEKKLVYLDDTSSQTILIEHLGADILPETLGGMVQTLDNVSDFVASLDGELLIS